MEFNQANNKKRLWPIIIVVSGFGILACACVEFHVLWAIAHIYQCGGKKEHYVWNV